MITNVDVHVKWYWGPYFKMATTTQRSISRCPCLCAHSLMQKTMTIRDICAMHQKTLSPTLTELLNENGDNCFTGPTQGTRDISAHLGRTKFMAVWTFSVPANQCFELKFIFRIHQGESDSYCDRLTILDRGGFYPIVLQSGVTDYDHPVQNDATTVSVVYYYTSLSRSVYWTMAPSLKSSDCVC